MKNKILLFIILFVYMIVPILIYCFDILFKIKFYILTIIGILIFILLKLFKISNDYLGISNINLTKSIKRNLAFIIICFIIILIVRATNFRNIVPNEKLIFYIFYIFISCPIQEFLYRGVFGYFEKVIKHKYLWVIVSSICYSFVHIIYKDYLTCILTFFVGIVWYLLYRKDYNLCGVVLSHIILWILTISLGIIN